MTWHFYSYDKLSKEQLYEIIRLRLEVFVVEQDAPYQDCDRKDQKSYHLFAEDNGEIVAYTRLIPAGVTFKEPCIGRVVTKLSHRKTGLGKDLMFLAIQAMEALYGTSKIRISAQKYLQKFYESFGFERVSDEYLEDGIPHVEMFTIIS